MNKELNDRRQMELDLREALERNELELHLSADPEPAD